MATLQPLIGIAAILGLAYLLSNNRKAIVWRSTFAGLVTTVVVCLLILKVPGTRDAFALLGQGINYVTGDYSRGAAGFWVEDGVIAYPVEEITIAGNLKAMLAGIVAVGNDVHVRGSKQTGSILIDRMTVAGE